jgi:ABC-type nickel/cobalt efflux system permease component RcnA
MLLIRRCAAIQQGFVLPLVMVTGLLLLLSGFSLQAMALHSLAQLRLQRREAQQRDAAISAAMTAATGVQRDLD